MFFSFVSLKSFVILVAFAGFVVAQADNDGSRSGGYSDDRGGYGQDDQGGYGGGRGSQRENRHRNRGVQGGGWKK